jgi:predicted GH43/DUF377 family glycosyl hydrolase
MAERLFQQLLIQPGDIAPSSERLEVIGTFNPGVTELGGNVVLMVRVAERPRRRREGFAALPRWEAGRVVVDWVPDDQVELIDPRVVRRKSDGLLRLTFTSHLRVMRSHDGRAIHEWDVSALVPHEPWEEYGVEDPRIVKMDDRYWITYVAVSRHGAATALASTRDFLSFERHGIIFYPENKDVVFFPERIAGRYVALHRPTTAHPFCRPEIWLAKSPDLVHWGAHQPLHGGTAQWESDRVGGGTPPLKTGAGWLEIHHASRRSGVAGQVGVYSAGGLLLDSDDPSHVVGHTRQPLWEPDTNFELSGFVPRVVFPTGIIARGNVLQIYYGAADTTTAVAEFRLDEVISSCTST